MDIRDATAEDAAAIAEIYNHAITHSTATWDTHTVDAANRRAWIANHQQVGDPVLVAVDDEAQDEQNILGYASYGQWRPFDGYRYTVENSVYVHHELRGGGTGTALLSALIDRARAQGVHVIVAGIDAANTGSIRLHERFGFTAVGHLPQVGVKFGGWLDLTFLQLTLDDRADPPS
ncbi:MAG: N-acetyltransferase family protein [Acidipropionibacterium acidipropionici]|uniref:GNAT family N-acetyltransferase n=1 Tax=Acidipropionibacterium acidipropionici TaxID=1748 RepID=UPI000410FEEA|nr:GNAT family N-acetyltransferase [Acidipropionibacterium acidipropionici]ALN14389.1 acetyltransferase [Acidipropionibacterium acidipropionici]APZ09852.1 N-acetyltransferase [Acidipropionibacterium acidipropionici]MDN6555431.1 N-acetyltransferase family protein [Acidipropionibacterium acidipropionici]